MLNPIVWIMVGFIGVVVVGGLFVASIYNGLVQLRNRFENAYSQIDVQLKRRYDLIPNLVESVKGAMSHERETLEAVIAARNSAAAAAKLVAQAPGDAVAMKSLIGAEGQLGGMLGRLMAVAENYPDLKANENMLSLQEELSTTENRIGFARQAYNDSVMNYNTRRESFPANLIAGTFNFSEATFWQIEEPAHREAPQISFSNDAE